MKTYYEKYGRARLLKLATHLREGNLGHKKFDFSTFNDIGENESKFAKNGCGTLGCAIGECPIVFPKLWHFRARVGSSGSIRQPRLKADHSNDETFFPSAKDAGVFFGLDYDSTKGLFFPSNYRPWNDTRLGEKATRKQVAASIRQFVKWYDKQQVAV